MFASFKIYGKFRLSTDAVSKYIWVIIKFFTGRSVGWVAFYVLSFLISLKTSSTLTLHKLNLQPLFKFFMAVTFGWFLNFIIALNIGWDLLLASGFLSDIPKLLDF